MSKVRRTGRKRHLKTEAKMAPAVKFLPGLRGGADWSIVEEGTHGLTLNRYGHAGIMRTPPIDDAASKFSQLHELLHAAHSPLEDPRDIPNPRGAGTLSARSIILAEELRIDMTGISIAPKEALPRLPEETRENLGTMFRMAIDGAPLVDSLLEATILWFPVTYFTDPDTDELVFLAWMFNVIDEPTSHSYRQEWSIAPGKMDRARATLLQIQAMMDILVNIIADSMGARRSYLPIYHALKDREGKPWSWETVLDCALAIQTVITETENERRQMAGGQVGSPNHNPGESWEDAAQLAADQRNKEEIEWETVTNDAEVDDNETIDSIRRRFGTGDDRENLEKAREKANGYGGASRDRGSPMRMASKMASAFDNHRSKEKHKPSMEERISQVKWGKMTTRTAPQTNKLPRMKISRSKYRAAEDGAIPRYPHRAFTDGRVFSRRRKVHGGSVLIDDSGSMGFDTDDVRYIVETAPAVNIAAYSGTYWEGELVILANGKGTYATIEAKNLPYGGGNTVDFPALQWLAKQEKPRIWVTDGYVVPGGGLFSYPAFVQCIQFCYENDINLVPNARAAYDVLRGARSIQLL